MKKRINAYQRIEKQLYYMKSKNSLPLVVGLTAALFTFIGFQMAPSDQQLNGDLKTATTKPNSEQTEQNAKSDVNNSAKNVVGYSKLTQQQIDALSEQQAKEKISELEQQIDALQANFEHQLTEQQQAFEEKNLKLAKELYEQSGVVVAEIMSGHQHHDEQPIDEETTEEPLISQKEISQYLNAPFAQVIEDGSENLINNFKQLNQENNNFAWSAMMEQQVNDYIITHDMAAGVTIENIRCANDACEITGFEIELATWRAITSGLEVQTWWDFHSTHSRTSNTEDGRNFFYLLAAKAPD